MTVYYFHKNFQKTLSLNELYTCMNRRVHPTTYLQKTDTAVNVPQIIK